MKTIIDVIQEEYNKYVQAKLGEETKPFPPMYAYESDSAAQLLVPKYDIGIALATDGCYLGFIFEKRGLPVKTVKLSRKGLGAAWNPIDKIQKEDIAGKKVILFDNDVVTGRTINRASKELNKYSPAYIDLLLVHETTLMNVSVYKKLSKTFLLPVMEDTLNKEVYELQSVEIIDNSVRAHVFHKKKEYYTYLNYNNNQCVSLNVRRNIPKTIRKVYTVQELTKTNNIKYDTNE